MPQSPISHGPQLNSALQKIRAGAPDEACDILQEVLDQDPQHADAHHLMGVALVQLRHISDGAQHIQKALQIDPTRLQFALDLIDALKKVNQPAMVSAIIEALPHTLRVHPKICPDHAQALLHQGRVDDAVAALRRGLEADPLSVTLLTELANTYRSLGDLKSAHAFYKEALSIIGPNATIYYNLGSVKLWQHRPAEAREDFIKALQLAPNDAETHSHLGFTHLLEGDFAQGWPEYEWRWQGQGFPNKQAPFPLWDGSDLTGQTLLLTAEQGFGDAFQFAQFIPEAARRSNARVVVAVQPPIAEVFADIEGVDEIITRGEPLTDVQAQAPLMTLPGILDTTIDDLPATPAPYLHAPQDRIAAWSATFADVPGRKVGLVWRGNPAQLNNTFRSCPAEKLNPLLDLKDTTFFLLQKDARNNERAALPEAIDLGPHLHDFADTAAAMHHLDLVISVCTSTAHLAGALGKPTWIMLSAASDWRWFLDRDDSPWYPTARLFRQSELHDWDGVIADVKVALAAL